MNGLNSTTTRQRNCYHIMVHANMQGFATLNPPWNTLEPINVRETNILVHCTSDKIAPKTFYNVKTFTSKLLQMN